MPKRLKLTSSTDETNVGLLLSPDAVFTIPYFQRPYKWKPERLQQLETDILNLVDGTTDTHFLGALIIHGRPSNPSDPNIYEVIDGQQRLTTTYLYICAAVKILSRNGEHKEAAGLFLRYLAINRNTTLISNAKLHSSKDDRSQLNRVLQDVLNDEKLREELGSFSFKALPAVGTDRGRLWSNYKAALRFLSAQARLETIQRVKSIYTALLDQISVVQIDVLDPINGPKIFDSLNSRQEPMTTGDLVRNEIFSRVADSEPTEVESLDHQYWQPFYEKFKNGLVSFFDEYFFPFGLTKNSNLKKSEVYSYLRNSWKDIEDPAIIIKDLSTYQNAFLDLIDASNRLQLDKTMSTRVQRLSVIAPSSTYPFLMPLLNSVKSGLIKELDCCSVLDVIESFLVRRAICGHEPTGLHAVFKKLWEDCDGQPTVEKVTPAIQQHKTVVWPSTNDVRSCIANRPLYGSSVTKFLLEEWNLHFGGDQPKIVQWIEHVLPDTMSDYWHALFSEEQHKALKDTLANLLPLSQPMNQSLGNGTFEKKKEVYSKDSAFKGTREFANEYSTWTPETLTIRAGAMADWAISRWPY